MVNEIPDVGKRHKTDLLLCAYLSWPAFFLRYHLIPSSISQPVVEMFIADIRIRLKRGVADPEGKNTKKALELLGFSEVSEVSTSKYFSVHLDVESEAAAKARVEKMCTGLLANPVINDYSYEIRVKEA